MCACQTKHEEPTTIDAEVISVVDTTEPHNANPVITGTTLVMRRIMTVILGLLFIAAVVIGLIVLI